MIPGKGMMLLLVCKSAAISSNVCSDPIGLYVLFGLEEITCGRDPSAKFRMLHIVSDFPQKSKL